MPRSDFRIVWVDLETTGIHPQLSDILELYAIVTDARGEEEFGELECRLQPVRPPAPDMEEALKVNGIDLSTWVPSHDREEMLCEFDGLVRAAGDPNRMALGGQNVAMFDWPFLLAAYIDEHKLSPRFRYAVDLAPMFWPAYMRGELESISLAVTAPRFGVTNEGSHRSKADVQRARAVYREALARGFQIPLIPR